MPGRLAMANLASMKEALVNNQHLSRFVILVSLVAALGGLLFGYDTAIISGAIPMIQNYFNLNASGLGWAVGCILIGCGLGAVLAGKAMDLYGRRAVLLFCAVLFALSGIGAGFSFSFSSFVFFRILGGFAVGSAAMVSPVYIAEMSPARKRGQLVSVYQLAIVGGILLAYFANYLLASIGENSWRWMFASQAAPAILFLIFLFTVPETPRWLVKKEKFDEAEKVLKKIDRTINPKPEMMSIYKSFQGQVSLKTVFSKKYINVLMVGLMIAVFQQITGINAILYYAPVIFKETGVASSNALLQTICIGAVNLLTTFIAIGFVDKAGRRKFLFTGSILMGISLLLVAFCFRYKYFSNYIVLIGTLMYVAAFGCTLGAVTWVYLSEIFPNRIRAIALSLATLALWLADFIVSYSFPLLSDRLGTAGTLIVYAVACALAAIYIFFKVPETRGRLLEDMERLFDANGEGDMQLMDKLEMQKKVDLN